MKKFLGITFGGLQRKTLQLSLVLLLLVSLANVAINVWSNQMLTDVVAQTREEQTQAISRISEETMLGVQENALVEINRLTAATADAEFSEVVHDLYTLQTMAQGIIENRSTLAPISVSPPSAAMAGTVSAMVLCEAGVDYTQSENLGLIAHLSTPMIALCASSDKIDGCFIGLEDGTDLSVDAEAAAKLDSQGNPIPFPVRQRPWYRGAAETRALFFTGIMPDAFTKRLLITCSLPIEVGGELKGVVGIDIILDGVSSFLSSDRSKGTIIFAVNDEGQLILSSESEGPFAVQTSDQAPDLRASDNTDFAGLVTQSLGEATGLHLTSVDGVPYFMAGTPMPTVGWSVITAVPKSLTDEPEKALLAAYDEINEKASATYAEGSAARQTIGILAAVVFVVLGAILSMLYARRISKPIETITRDIVDAGNTGSPFVMKDAYRTNDEIEVLAESFAELSDKTLRYIDDITRITAEKERIHTELHMANLIQASLLPHAFPPFPDRKEFDLFASMDPAKEVGGDFYDFFFIDHDHLCLVMADVSGKGIPAALFMMLSKTILQSCAMLGRSSGEILQKTNEALCSNNQVEMFVTVWLGIMDVTTGKIICANAGHEYPILKRVGGSYEVYKDHHGFVIGGIDGMKYKEYEIQLNPGDRLFLYTDGVPEATNSENELFGLDRTLQALNSAAEEMPRETIKAVRRAVDDFVKEAEPFDDLTMLSLYYTGIPSDEPAGPEGGNEA